MTVLSDKWIREMSKSKDMISPFEEKQIRGDLSSIHFLTAKENFSPTTEPIDPPKNEYSNIQVITGILFIFPLKTNKASFSPVFS